MEANSATYYSSDILSTPTEWEPEHQKGKDEYDLKITWRRTVGNWYQVVGFGLRVSIDKRGQEKDSACIIIDTKKNNWQVEYERLCLNSSYL